MSSASIDRSGETRPSLVGGGRMQWRYVKDRMARAVVWAGGLGVIAALLLIFVYLLSEVAPLFAPAKVDAIGSFALPGDASATRFLAVEEQGEVAMRITASGQAVFFSTRDGALRSQAELPTDGHEIVAVAELSSVDQTLAALRADGAMIVFAHEYRVSYPDNRRTIDAGLTFPYGRAALPLGTAAQGALAVRQAYGTLLAAAVDADGTILLKRWTRSASLMGDGELTADAEERLRPTVRPDRVLLDPLLGWLYVVDTRGSMNVFRMQRGRDPVRVQTFDDLGRLVVADQLAGGISLLLGHADGTLSQWFPTRGDEGARLTRIRDFRMPGDAAMTALGIESRRRGFAAGDAEGRVAMFYSTSRRRVFDERLFDAPISRLVFNPRAQLLLAVADDGTAKSFAVHNEHPEVSWSSLWGQTWYESYQEPQYVWQSSSASSDFEPKFSLTPLALGTLKGAFYAMIFAIPLAVLGAVFTANFMSPKMRQVVKPSVEVLAALPSVVLGFLAGLWLAPYVETNLPGMFLALLLLPLSIPLFGYLWASLPRNVRLRVPPGWEAALLIPVIVLVMWFCFSLAKPLEAVLFDGNMQAWMQRTLGIDYAQRNALVVGIAMGVAVIPIIFSIAEDAIFSVPRHLTLGSLALGATPWQTLVGVVLPTASPGIFSAIMIGMGRAVGETMIVLMATGNTPVMDFSLFTGMRTLAANIAVEMPESEVGSTHFRLLFMAGLVLFIFTFLFNTLAELVRSRLRKRYSNL